MKEEGFDSEELTDQSVLQTITKSGVFDKDRLTHLLERGILLSIALEKWSTLGVWVLGWNDAEYPEQFRKKLKNQAPPVIYGIGDAGRLGSPGLAVVGSRFVDSGVIEFCRSVGRSCAEEDMQVVSGGAKGVDREVMFASLEAGGQATGVLADSLLRQAVSANFRNAVVEGRLTLISPFEPESRFFVASAMSRNKLIYALGDYAVVVSSSYRKGGTWAGATEDLKYGWTPLFVRRGDNIPQGNIALLDSGAKPVDESAIYEGNLFNEIYSASDNRLSQIELPL